MDRFTCTKSKQTHIDTFLGSLSLIKLFHELIGKNSFITSKPSNLTSKSTPKPPKKPNFLVVKRDLPSAKLDTAQHWPSIGNFFAEDRLPILCRCWNYNSGIHLVDNFGPNSGRQHFFPAQQRADAISNSGFLISRMVCYGKSDTWPSNVPFVGLTLALLLPELDAIVQVIIGLV